MEQKLELLYIGAAAIFFAVAVLGWMETERKMHQGLEAVEHRLNEERVVIRAGGD